MLSSIPYYSAKSNRGRARSKPKKQFNIEEKTDNVEPKAIKNKDAIAIHLLNVKRFTGPPVSAISFANDDTIEIPDEMIEKARLKLLKPMIKNFELDHKHSQEVQSIDAYDLDKELYDFNNDTKDINQPAIFTEYIRMLFN